jgi:NADH:ubiquinone oxidoreductase subunit 4 (subunit M)
MELLIIVIFSVRDIIIFYICFEGILIPMYIIIGRYGSRERKVRAGYLFFIYTLVGSLLMLLGIVVIIVKTGTTNMIEIREIMRIKPMGWEIEK